MVTTKKSTRGSANKFTQNLENEKGVFVRAPAFTGTSGNRLMLALEEYMPPVTL